MKQRLLEVNHYCIRADSEERFDKIAILPSLFPKASSRLNFPLAKRVVSCTIETNTKPEFQT